MNLVLPENNQGVLKLNGRTWAMAGAYIVILLVASVSFKLAFLPHSPAAPYSLIMTPAIYESVSHLLPHDWAKLLLPFEYEPGRHYWATTVIYLAYASERYLGPVASYIVLSSLFITVTFFSSLVVTRSFLFSSTLAFLFAFGTQLNYQFTYGNLVAFYIILSYIAINFAIASALIMGRLSSFLGRLAFVVTLVVVALSNEMWINYATALAVATVFGILWGMRHQRYDIRNESAFLLAATVLVLAAYLSIRMRLVHQYLAPGAEEELLVTYKYKFLIIDDFISNFFTLLYTALTNYLPSFLTSSNSIVYTPPGSIVAEQHGYDQAYSSLVLANHLFMWRFYAGVYVTLFIGLILTVFVRSWRRPSSWEAIFVALALMVLAGFSTHLSIKMRPYNSVPALPYKAIISITALTVLIAFAAAKSSLWFRSVQARFAFISLIWVSAFLAALTRPYMQSRLLAEVGLVGIGDPLGQILNWFQ